MFSSRSFINFRRFDCQDLLIIYKTYIRLHLEYCIQSWSPYLRKDIQCLEGVKRATTKLVPALRKLDYGQRLQKLGLITLETRRRRGDLIVTFKIMTGKEKVSSEHFFHLSTIGYQTRGHSLKIAKQRTRLDLRKHFFSQRVVNERNGLPSALIEAKSYMSFRLVPKSVTLNDLERCNGRCIAVFY